IFLINSNLPYRYLHSFPTRRSSDLDYSGYNKVTNVTRCLCHAHSRRKYVENIKGKGKNVHEDMPEIKIVEMYKEVFKADKKHFRSEEHTSELQSRFDLVCRLLLEKK